MSHWCLVAGLWCHVAMPSQVFISKEDGGRLKQILPASPGGHSILRVTLARPAGRLPMLVAGMPQRGTVGHNEFSYYEIWAPFGKDDLTISLAPSFGNADLFVASANLPTAYE